MAGLWGWWVRINSRGRLELLRPVEKEAAPKPSGVGLVVVLVVLVVLVVVWWWSKDR